MSGVPFSLVVRTTVFPPGTSVDLVRWTPGNEPAWAFEAATRAGSSQRTTHRLDGFQSTKVVSAWAPAQPDTFEDDGFGGFVLVPGTPAVEGGVLDFEEYEGGLYWLVGQVGGVWRRVLITHD